MKKAYSPLQINIRMFDSIDVIRTSFTLGGDESGGTWFPFGVQSWFSGT